ncbi:MAG: hypothetical protein ACR2FF_09130 [Mycobacteriales bacterium]
MTFTIELDTGLSVLLQASRLLEVIACKNWMDRRKQCLRVATTAGEDVRDKPRSGCAINAALEVLGDPWSLIVLMQHEGSVLPTHSPKPASKPFR